MRRCESRDIIAYSSEVVGWCHGSRWFILRISQKGGNSIEGIFFFPVRCSLLYDIHYLIFYFHAKLTNGNVFLMCQALIFVTLLFRKYSSVIKYDILNRTLQINIVIIDSKYYNRIIRISWRKRGRGWVDLSLSLSSTLSISLQLLRIYIFRTNCLRELNHKTIIFVIGNKYFHVQPQKLTWNKDFFVQR